MAELNQPWHYLFDSEKHSHTGCHQCKAPDQLSDSITHLSGIFILASSSSKCSALSFRPIRQPDTRSPATPVRAGHNPSTIFHFGAYSTRRHLFPSITLITKCPQGCQSIIHLSVDLSAPCRPVSPAKIISALSARTSDFDRPLNAAGDPGDPYQRVSRFPFRLYAGWVLDYIWLADSGGRPVESKKPWEAPFGNLPMVFQPGFCSSPVW